jgi:hypothetical protein
MAQTYTLDEAATRLGMPAEEFKRRLKDEWKSIRSFRDGATLRFRSADIDELARSLGQASDPGLQLGAPGASPQTGSSDEFLLADPPKAGAVRDDDSAIGTEDIFSLAAGDSGRTKKPKASDSDVRLEVSNRPHGAGDPESAIPTEEIALDLGGSGSGHRKTGKPPSSQKLKAPKSGPNLAGPGSGNKIPGPPASSPEPMNTDSSSEFELSLDADSGSFELQLNPDSSEEVPLGDHPKPTASSSRSGGQSGINLAKPADSGVSLERGGSGASANDSDDFELSLDPSEAGPKSSGKLSAPKSGKSKPVPAKSDSDSEFELTLDDSSGVSEELAAELQKDESKGDIFETDFELPAVQDDADSGSEVVAVESSDTDLENSDFDLALDEADAPAADESESQVVLLDDEAAAPTPSSGRRRAAAAVAAAGAEEAERESASAALRGVRRDEEEEEEEAPVRVAAPARWPSYLLVPLGLSFVFMFLGGIMAFELLHGMWGYNQGTKPGGTIVRGFASMLDMEPKE